MPSWHVSTRPIGRHSVPRFTKQRHRLSFCQPVRATSQRVELFNMLLGTLSTRCCRIFAAAFFVVARAFAILIFSTGCSTLFGSSSSGRGCAMRSSSADRSSAPGAAAPSGPCPYFCLDAGRVMFRELRHCSPNIVVFGALAVAKILKLKLRSVIATAPQCARIVDLAEAPKATRDHLANTSAALAVAGFWAAVCRGCAHDRRSARDHHCSCQP